MNIAVCIVGRMTSYENNIGCFSRFLDHLKSIGNTYIFSSINTENYLDDVILSDEYRAEYERKMNELTDQKSKCNFEAYKLPDELEPHAYKIRMFSMFYNQLRCMQMIDESGIKFDIVFKWRTEIDYCGELQIETNPGEDTVYVPGGNDYGGLNDQVAYGNQDSMRKYSEAYNHLIELIFAKGTYVHPETLLGRHVSEAGISTSRFTLSYHLHR